ELGRAGRGVLELAQAGVGGAASGDAVDAAEREVEWMGRLSASIRRPVSFLLMQNHDAPELWRRLLARGEDAAARGAGLRPQVAARPFGMLVGHASRANPFVGRPTYRTLAHFPIEERAARLRDPEIRRRILAERPDSNAEPGTLAANLNRSMYARLFPL